MLVAGGAGFLGRAIARSARHAGYDVHLTWRTTAPPDGFAAHHVDLNDGDATGRLVSQIEPAVVVAAIGGPHRPETAAERLAAWLDHPVAMTSLLEACSDRSVHFVAMASAHEYAPSEQPHDESAPTGPISLRGIAAGAAAETVRWWAKRTGSPTTMLRPFSVYGPGEPPDRVVPTLLRAATSGEPFLATRSGSSRDFVFVDDVARAVILACSQQTVGEFNLGSGRSTSLDELIRAAERVTGATIDVRRGAFEPRPWDRACWVADPTRACDELGWTATTSLDDGLRRSLP